MKFNFFICCPNPGVKGEVEKVLKEINFPFDFEVKFLNRLESSEEDIKAEIKKSHVMISDPHIAHLLTNPKESCPNLRWFQSTFAGVDNFRNMKPCPYGPEFAKLPFVVTRGATLFGPAMAEYAISAVVMLQRRFFSFKELQPEKKSPYERRGPAVHFELLSNLRIGILGASGSIGQDIARRFYVLGSPVWGVCKHIRKEGEPKLTPQVESHLNAHLPPADICFEKMFALDEEKDESQKVLREFLSGVDVLINVLPSTPETKYLLGGRTSKDGKPLPSPLESCKRNCVFINMGRGTIIKEEVLVDVLKKKWIQHAVVCILIIH